jgi:cysteine synthase
MFAQIPRAGQSSHRSLTSIAESVGWAKARCAILTFTQAELEAVIALVRASVPPTPQYAWPLLNARLGVDVLVKHENHTPIGAFKVRGGLVYLNRLKRERPRLAGIITATRGNHGQSLARRRCLASTTRKSTPSSASASARAALEQLAHALRALTAELAVPRSRRSK